MVVVAVVEGGVVVLFAFASVAVPCLVLLRKRSSQYPVGPRTREEEVSSLRSHRRIVQSVVVRRSSCSEVKKSFSDQPPGGFYAPSRSGVPSKDSYWASQNLLVIIKLPAKLRSLRSARLCADSI